MLPFSHRLLSFAVISLLGACGDDTAPTCPTGQHIEGGVCVPDDAGTRDAGTDSIAPDDAGPDVPSACTTPCGGETPHCNESGGMCVRCVENEHCGGGGLMCVEGACVECTENTHCTEATAPLCATTSENAGRCIPCTDNTHCDGISGPGGTLGLCDTSAEADMGVCVECTQENESACGDNVCDVQNRTCSDIERSEVGLCGECISGSQCAEGQACAQETFDGSPTRFYCAWLFDAPAGPNGACSRTPPYIRNNAEVTSVGGETVSVCQLATTTCQSFSDYRNKDCDGETEEGNAQCGLEGVNDGLCRMLDAAADRCTYRCGSDDDCRVGFGCNTGASTPYCNF